MPVSLQSDYRRSLYAHYVSTHFGLIHSVSPGALEEERRVWREYFAEFLPEDKNARLLDLGCGYGSFLYFLREEGYCNTWGVDMSLEQVETARKLGIENVSQGDCLEFLAARRRELDCLTTIDLLEHLTKEEALALFQAAYQALRPGGRLVLRVPNADGPFGAKILYSDFTHERAFTPSSIRQVLAATGFARVEVYAEGPRVHGPISACRWVLWKLICAAIRLYLAVETGRLAGHLLTQNLIAVAWKNEISGRGEADSRISYFTAEQSSSAVKQTRLQEGQTPD